MNDRADSLRSRATERFGRGRAWLTRHLDVALPAAVVAIFGLMIVPLPPAILDLLIATNLGFAAMLLTLSLQVSDALEISAFPTLLLLTTLFRLGLEICATRLVLLHARAGAVIHAFGSFVVGGNLVVGLVIFLILTLVQYVVISKGAERVAEVAARFTLDALPGRQMAIDADVRAGFIDTAEATRRRAGLGREAQLFGSMDGAMKFVKGDAIAGLVILGINLVGGLAIGVLARDMSPTAALRTYAVLTIGGGLVAQLPALVISVAAGIVVTRVASEPEPDVDAHAPDLAPDLAPTRAPARLGRDVAQQLGRHPAAPGVAAALLLVLASTPGLPAWPFLVPAVVAGWLAWRGRQARRTRPVGLEAGEDRGVLTPWRHATAPYLVRRAISVALVGRSESAPPPDGRRRLGPVRVAGELTHRVRAMLWTRLGLVMTRVTVGVTAEQLEDATATQTTVMGFRLHLGDGTAAIVRGWGAPLSLDATEDRIEIARRIAREIAARARSLIGVQDTEAWLSACARTQPALVRELVPRSLSLMRLTELLRALVGEGVSLEGPVALLEALVVPPSPANAQPPAVGATLERARAALGARLVGAHLDSAGRLRAVELEALIEDAVRDGVRDLGAEGRVLALEPAIAKDMVAAVTTAIASADVGGGGRPPPVVLTVNELRPHVRALLAAALPGVAVLSYGELPPDLPVDFVARARIGA